MGIESSPQRKTVASETSVTPDTSAERIPTITHQVEDVVVHTKDTAMLCRQNPNHPACTHETCSLLEDEISHSEICTVYEKCAKHEIFSFGDIKESVDMVTRIVERELTNADPEEATFANTKLRLLSSRTEEVRLATNRYIRTLTEFHNIGRQRMRLEPEDFKEKLVNIDRRRKVSHDAVIAALSEFTATIFSLKNYGFLEGISVEEWDMGLPIRAIDPTSTVVQVFSRRFIDNRDLVRDWAVSANLHDDIGTIRSLVTAREASQGK